jgi:hypothetical protein
MGLIVSLEDERLKVGVYDNGPVGLGHALQDLHLSHVSLRAALKERDDYKAGGQAYWDGLVNLRAERDAALLRAEEAEGKLCRVDEILRTRYPALYNSVPGEHSPCRHATELEALLSRLNEEEVWRVLTDSMMSDGDSMCATRAVIAHLRGGTT